MDRLHKWMLAGEEFSARSFLLMLIVATALAFVMLIDLQLARAMSVHTGTFIAAQCLSAYQGIYASYGWLGVIVAAVFVVPPIEEAVFRLLLIGGAMRLWRKCSGRPAGPRMTAMLVIGSSLLFALNHGGGVNIFSQGIEGLVFALAFLKGSGYGERLGKGYLASTLVHATFNAFIIGLSMSGAL